MNDIIKLPSRAEVAAADTWDLSPLFADDSAWEAALAEFEALYPGYAKFQGRLAESAQTLADCLQFDSELERRAERLGNYAFLKSSEDQGNATYQRLVGKFQMVAVRANEAASFIRPEILAIDAAVLEGFLRTEVMAPYRLLVERLIRFRPHTLSEREERLLAMQGEMAGTASHVFEQLHDADLKFGTVKNERGETRELSPATFTQFLQSPDRAVRKTAFHQFYAQFDGHKNSLAAMLNGSIQKDIYYARARGYESARQMALFADNIPLSVYDNLIDAVRQHIPSLYRYYELRRRKMGLDEIHHYDTYAPILSDIDVEYRWEEAAELVVASLAPLGEEYCQTLRQGLLGRWCDRYPNAGKQSGAFSSGGYDGPPYILLNYKPSVLNDVFTLAHEAGHSMHTYFSARHQPFEYYHYTIFVAEVASTFNELLLTHHMLAHATNGRERAYLINHQIDDIRATVFRQTMFAEFEKLTHAMAESGEPLTIEAFRSVYGQLLRDYFGPDFSIDDELSLECLRIPHFYRAFYVYKYATGMSAAIALSRRVLQGGQRELQDYLGFLKGGCSQYPLDLLRGAGVDLASPQPVSNALTYFGELVSQLEALL